MNMINVYYIHVGNLVYAHKNQLRLSLVSLKFCFLPVLCCQEAYISVSLTNHSVKVFENMCKTLMCPMVTVQFVVQCSPKVT